MHLFLAGSETTSMSIQVSVYYPKEQLIHNCMDLFLAGSETTSKAIQVSVYYTKEQRIHNCMDLFLAGSEAQVNLGECLLHKGTADPQLHGSLPDWRPQASQFRSASITLKNSGSTTVWISSWLETTSKSIQVSVFYTK